ALYTRLWAPGKSARPPFTFIQAELPGVPEIQALIRTAGMPTPAEIKMAYLLWEKAAQSRTFTRHSH
ncbi:MAG TPA: hypothetical protein VJT09_01450, partial [Pyrinomonadaceae bacterium]|nr:hypothetical protein [Pyrinomonadaceae bacterium]